MDHLENIPGTEPENTSITPETELRPPEDPVFSVRLHDTVPAGEPAAQPEVQPAATETFAAFPPEKPIKEKREKKPVGKLGKTLLCGALALVVLIGSCALTAFAVDSLWENRVEELEQSFENEMDLMQQLFENKLSAVEEKLGGSTGNSGNIVLDPVTNPGGLMNPGQVYEQNVDSVVLIYNEITASLYGQSTAGTSTGSGVIISENGYVITNHHVIEGNGTLTVVTGNGTRYAATLIGSDATNDVALLKVEAEGLKAAKLGSSADLKVGDQVAAIGNPLGELTSTLTVGYISAKERDVSTENTIINMLQTDAAINSGNSGGPLFNMYGEVIGITTAKYSGTTSSGASIEGIGFAIPMDDVREILADLMEFGYVKSAYLGVMVRNMTTSEIADSELFGGPAGGVYVESAEAGNCAANAGVRARDIIINLGGYDVQTMSDLTRILRRLEPGDTTTITVFRSGKEVTMSITLDEKPRTTTQEPEIPQFPDEMPSDGSFEEWYEYFAPFFGQEQD